MDVCSDSIASKKSINALFPPSFVVAPLELLSVSSFLAVFASERELGLSRSSVSSAVAAISKASAVGQKESTSDWRTSLGYVVIALVLPPVLVEVRIFEVFF